MKKLLLLSVLTTAALCSCTKDTDLSVTDNAGSLAAANNLEIGFEGGSFNFANSRANATGKDAADLLGKEFVVFGTLNDADDALETVFDNYRVHYAGKKTSPDDVTNAYKWSYLYDADGEPLISAGIPPVTQGVKYWNLAAKRYDFVAFAGRPSTAGVITSTNQYQFTLDAADMGKTYVSDHVTKTQNFGTEKVNMTFYRMLSRVRIGFYETVPGYAVKNLRFYYGDKRLSINLADAVTQPGLRATYPTSGEYNITYDAAGIPQAALNIPSATIMTDLSFDRLLYTNSTSSAVSPDLGYLDADGALVPAPTATDAVYLSTTTAAPTWAKRDANENPWVDIYPYPNKDLSKPYSTEAKKPGCPNNLVLRVDFDLVPLDGTGAIISVYNASAVVPAAWAQWKPNYAYTYIFKITDKVKGSTTPPTDPIDDPNTENPDPDPSLTPIVFDAEVSAIEDYNEEYITGLTALGGDAITTYCPKSNILNAQEYAAGEEIQLSSISKGQWCYTYISSTDADDSYTELDANEKFYDWATSGVKYIAGVPDASDPDRNTINKAGEYGGVIKTTGPGWYIVQLRYLPYSRPDYEGNYLNVYKVIKVRP